MLRRSIGGARRNLLDATRTPPATLVIFGATGDLTRRLLVPSIINLVRSGLVGDDLSVVGLGIEPGDDEMLRLRLDEFLSGLGGDAPLSKDAAWTLLRQRVSYIGGDFTGDELYLQLSKKLAALKSGNAAFYLAVPPQFFGTIVDKLAGHGLTKETPDAFRRIAIEKPFGTDLASARALNEAILSRLSESQVYRLDHFLGKETVQNIMTARFANMMIESVWNNNYIDHVQITAAPAVSSTTRRAHCGTWCLTICSNCWRWSRWSRRTASTPKPSGTKRVTL
jgi:glucose-6-phosphate 1-dehydrogenase